VVVDVPGLINNLGGDAATGDSDIRNYYDKLSAEQKVRLTPALSRLATHSGVTPNRCSAILLNGRTISA
jgi:hypothetical protein